MTSLLNGFAAKFPGQADQQAWLRQALASLCEPAAMRRHTTLGMKPERTASMQQCAPQGSLHVPVFVSPYEAVAGDEIDGEGAAGAEHARQQ